MLSIRNVISAQYSVTATSAYIDLPGIKSVSWNFLRFNSLPDALSQGSATSEPWPGDLVIIGEVVVDDPEIIQALVDTAPHWARSVSRFSFIYELGDKRFQKTFSPIFFGAVTPLAFGSTVSTLVPPDGGQVASYPCSFMVGAHLGGKISDVLTTVELLS